MDRSPDVAVHGIVLAAPMSGPRVRQVVAAVFRGERVKGAAASVAFLSSQRMRALNRRMLGHDRATDVIAFGLEHAGRLVADLYICPSVARREARSRQVPLAEELDRLIVHGMLHAVGWDHPTGKNRTVSAMWRRQERYVRRLRGQT